jgi:tetratricopeptide (TPR) repeat protein
MLKVTLPRPLLPFAVVLAASGFSAAQSDGPDAEASFARGVQLHQSGDILGAIENYLAALKTEPDRIDARSNLGAAYVRLGRYEEAVEAYHKALAVSENPTVRFNLALALYKGGRIPEAAQELRRVVDADSANKNAVLLLADCHLQMGNDGEVVLLLENREVDLGDDRLYAYLLGNAFIRQNEIPRGQAWIDRLFKGGDTAEARVLMGVAHIRRSDYQSALAEFQRAAELAPTLPNVQSFLGRALMERGQRPEATEAFRKELARNPNDFDSNLYLGLLKRDENQLDEALDHLKRASRLRPGDVRVLYGLGSVHFAAGRVEEAQRALETVVKEAPDYQQAHVLLATVYYRQKKKDLAEREKAIVEKLKAERQAKEPGASDELGPAYKGEPSSAEPARKPPGGGE